MIYISTTHTLDYDEQIKTCSRLGSIYANEPGNFLIINISSGGGDGAGSADQESRHLSK